MSIGKASIFLVIVASLVFGSWSNAANPSDFGLKEGDLISAIFSDDPDVYIINEHGYKRLFLNPEIFNFYGHLGGFFNVKLITSEVRDSFTTSGLFRDCESGDEKVYGVDIDGEDTGQLHWVNTSGEQAVSDDPDFFKKVFCVNQNEFKWYPKGVSLNTVKDVPKYDRMKEIEKVSTKEKLEAKAELKDVGQVVICHYPPGNITAYQTLTVGASALKAHLDHGDTVGPCPTPQPSPTATPTPTPIVSITPSPTASPSYSPTPTPVFTPTPTITPTPTPIDFGPVFIPPLDPGRTAPGIITSYYDMNWIVPSSVSFDNPQTAEIWNNRPTNKGTVSDYVPVSGYSWAKLEFSFKNADGTAYDNSSCQYAITTSSDGINQNGYSTFLYFNSSSYSRANCQNIAIFPIGSWFSGVETNYLKISAWKASGTGYLSGKLYLMPTPTVLPSIIQENFNSYSSGAVVGQGGWYNRANGLPWVIQGSVIQEGAKAIYNNNTGADSVITKNNGGNKLANGKQSFYIRTQNRSSWNTRATNFQLGIFQDSWDGPSRATLGFEKDGHVNYVNGSNDARVNFDTYNDNAWNLVEIEWRSTDASARYRINSGTWTNWIPFTGDPDFTGFDTVGFVTWYLGTGGVYVDGLH